MEDIVRVIRILEYIGPLDWIETTLAKSFAAGPHILGKYREVREVLRTAPEPWLPSNPNEAVNRG